MGQTWIAAPESTMGHVASYVVRTTVDVESECGDPHVVSRSTLNMIVHMTQRVSSFCYYRHGVNTRVSHLIFGNMSRFVKKKKNETLSIGLVVHRVWALGSFLCLCLRADLCPRRLCLSLCSCPLPLGCPGMPSVDSNDVFC